MGSDAAMVAKAYALSLQSLETCSSFHAEILARRCLTSVTLGIPGLILSIHLPYHQLGIAPNYKLVG